MLFNSFAFLIFYVCVTLAFYATPQKWKWLVLLIASCYFYAFLIPVYLFVLLLVIIIDYVAGRLIDSSHGGKRKFFLALSITANLAVLIIFKYHDFFAETINGMGGLFLPESFALKLWKLALPVGLSFHTFQAMSYTIEVYRGKQRAEKRFGIYALYVMFYPQLVAGPIERPQNLLPQFDQKHMIDYNGIAVGLKYMLWGFFLKLVVADRLGIYVDYIYRDPAIHSRLALITAGIFYSFQIYGDFAGYSLIALGSAATMGFTLSINFKHPYLASSLRAFWRRWNMTLMRWFRDYIYFPMGGSRVSILKTTFNILVVFILSGLWHGANWTFIVWGLVHGTLMTGGYLRRKYLPPYNLPVLPAVIFTFLLVSICWVFFRSPDLHTSFIVLRRIFSPDTVRSQEGEWDERVLLIYSVLGIITVVITEWLTEFYPDRFKLMHHGNSWVRLTTCVGLIIVIMLFGVFDGSQFIYFQF